MKFATQSQNILPSGLTLLQVNPDCAAQLSVGAHDFGWLYRRGADNQWVTLRRLSADEVSVAQDQAADMAVLQGTNPRGAA